MENPKTRSLCPLSCTLELIGDRWSLLILRDMLFFRKTMFKEFLASPEKVSTNILASRLKRLEKCGLIITEGTSKRKKYFPSPKGMELIPVMESIARFGTKNFVGSQEYLDQVMQKAG